MVTALEWGLNVVFGVNNNKDVKRQAQVAFTFGGTDLKQQAETMQAYTGSCNQDLSVLHLY